MKNIAMTMPTTKVDVAMSNTLTRCANAQVASVWNSAMIKSSLLEQDLRYFAPRAVADLKEAVAAALKMVAQLRVRSIEQPLALLGYVYVLEGSTLGAQVLRPLYARAFLLTGEEGLAYLSAYGSEVKTRWAQFQERMNKSMK